MSAPAQTLQIAGLRVEGEAGRMLLRVPALTVEPGSAVVLRGPSGAGKSTFLHAVAGLIAPAEGAVIWGQTDLATLRPAARAAFRRAHMGIVFQDHLLFEELSVAGNAALAALYAPSGARAAIRAGAAAGLARLGLSGRGRHRALTCSGGERQRIAVARALAGDPGIVLADEPTASLDRANAERLADDLLALARSDGKTLIVVSHDPALQARADRIIEIADGQIAEPAHA